MNKLYLFRCPTCERRYLNPEQADHFSAIQRLEQLIEEQDQRVEGDVSSLAHSYLDLGKSLCRRGICLAFFEAIDARL